MISFLTKFMPGDYGYILYQKPIMISKKCDLCNNEKYMLFEGVNILCPKCKGEKILNVSEFKAWSIEEKPQKITSISIRYSREGIYSVKYNTFSGKKSNDYIFNSVKEGVFYRNKLNKVPITSEIDIFNNYMSKNFYGKYKLMELNSKYNIGDFVYMSIFDKEDGVFKPLLIQVTEIRATIKEDSIILRYRLGNSYNRSEKNVFASLTDVEARCVQLNNDEEN